MSAVELDSEVPRQSDVKGCEKEESTPEKPSTENGYVGQAQLLDLSDDVLLYILRYCAPHDLKALGFTCARLGSLVLERSLWTVVDARGVCTGRSRMRWLMQALHAGTRDLLLTGFAKQAKGCRGHVNKTRKQVEDERSTNCRGDFEPILPAENASLEDQQVEANRNGGGLDPPYPLFRQHARLHINANSLPRRSGSPSWPEECDWEDPEAETSEECNNDTGDCAGPVFTFSTDMIKELATRCPRLTTLNLEYCNINCNKIGPSNFPPSVKRLSLRGTRCYNAPLDKSYLFRINDYLPALEYLDVSECLWLEPPALLPLSKLVNLRSLLMRECPAMAEFVAYVSLATRYGFRALEVLDVRGSPLGDSEVSALGWLPELRELYMSAPSAPGEGNDPAKSHHHYIGDPLPRRKYYHQWEAQIPEYYRSRCGGESEGCRDSSSDSPESVEDIGAQVEIIRHRLLQTSRDLVSIEIHRRPTNEADRETQSQQQNGDDQSSAQKRKTNDQEEEISPGPSKRPKTEETSTNTASTNTSPVKTVSTNTSSFKTVSFNTSPDKRTVSTNTSPAKTVATNTEGVTETDNNDTLGENETENIDETATSKDTKKSLTENDKALELLRNEYKKFKFKIYGKDGPVSNVNKNSYSESNSPQPSASNSLLDNRPTTSKDNDKKSEKDPNDDSNVTTFNVCVNKSGVSITSQDGANGNQSQESPNDNVPNQEPNSDKTYKYKIDVNDGASTSRYSVRVNVKDDEPSPKRQRLSQDGTSPDESSSENGDVKTDDSNADTANEPSSSDRDEPVAGSQYVRFRRNQDPVVFQCPVAQQQEQELAAPRHAVLYVNLGQHLHAVYRLLPNRPFPNNHVVRTMNEHLEASSLVTDASIRRFGRADGEDINILHIGPNGPQLGGRDTSGRPNRSNLRILSATGYRNITNRSLVHLATAAPFLESIDFTNTGITESGVERFKALRPDVAVKFSTFEREDVEE